MGIWSRDRRERRVDTAPLRRRSSVTVATGGVTASAHAVRDPLGLLGGSDRDKAVHLAARSPVAAACLDLMADNASALDLELVTRRAGAARTRHPLLDLWNVTPNGAESAVVFRRRVWHRLVRRGQAFVILDRGANRVDPPRSATLFTGNVVVNVDKPTRAAPHGALHSFLAEIQPGEWIALAPSEVLWLRFPDPDDAWGCMSPLTRVLRSMALYDQAAEWQARTFEVGGADGVVYLGQVGTDEEWADLRDEVDEVLNNPSNAGRVIPVTGDSPPAFVRTSMTPAEVAFLETLDAADRRITQGLGVPLDLINGDSTYANQRDARRRLYTEAILPKLAVVASQIDGLFLAGTDLDARFDLSGVEELQEGLADKAATLVSLVSADILTLDEARDAAGYDALPGGVGGVTHTAYVEALRPAPVPQVVLHAGGSPALPAVDAGGGDPVRAIEAPARAVESAGPPAWLAERLDARVADLVAAQAADVAKRAARTRKAPTAAVLFDPVQWAERAADRLEGVLASAGDLSGTDYRDTLTVLVDVVNARTAAQVGQWTGGVAPDLTVDPAPAVEAARRALGHLFQTPDSEDNSCPAE